MRDAQGGGAVRGYMLNVWQILKLIIIMINFATDKNEKKTNRN